MKSFLLAALLPAAALAQDYEIGAITIDRPVILETPSRAPVAGGYMTLANAGPDDRLLAVRVDPAVSEMAQLHEMRMEENVMRMSEIEGGIALPSGGTVTLEQGGMHVMFMRLAEPLTAGDEVAATLVFEEAGEVEVLFAVEPRGGATRMDHGGTDHSDH